MVVYKREVIQKVVCSSLKFWRVAQCKCRGVIMADSGPKDLVPEEWKFICNLSAEVQDLLNVKCGG